MAVTLTILLLIVWVIYWLMRTGMNVKAAFKRPMFYISLVLIVAVPFLLSLATSLLFEIPVISSILLSAFVIVASVLIDWHGISNIKRNRLHASQKHPIFNIGFVFSVILPILFLTSPLFFNTIDMLIEAVKHLPSIFETAETNRELLTSEFKLLSLFDEAKLREIGNLAVETDVITADGRQGADIFKAFFTKNLGQGLYLSLDGFCKTVLNDTLFMQLKVVGGDWAILEDVLYSGITRNALFAAATESAAAAVFIAGSISSVLLGSLFATVGRVLKPGDDSDWPAKIVLTNILYCLVAFLVWKVSPYVISDTLEKINEVFGEYFRATFSPYTAPAGWAFLTEYSLLIFFVVGYALISLLSNILHAVMYSRNRILFIIGAASAVAFPTLLFILLANVTPTFTLFSLCGFLLASVPSTFIYLFGYFFMNEQIKKWKMKLGIVCGSTVVIAAVPTLILVI